MVELKGENRYEIDGRTVLHIPWPRLTDEQSKAIEAQEQVTFFSVNENSGKAHGKQMQRSIMLPTGVVSRPDGLYVTLTLDVSALPVSRKELDGNKY